MNPNIDWDRLLTTADWAAALKQIIDASQTAANSNDVAALGNLQDLLRTYIKRSPPKVQSLDDIAGDLVDQLMAADINATLAAIQSSDAHLKKQIAIINGATTDAKTDAAQLRLEPVINQVNDLKAALEKLKQDYESSKNTADVWYQKIQVAIASLQTFLAQ